MSEKPINILLIEDNPSDARIVREFLKEIPGSLGHLEWVSSLQKGLQNLSEFEFHLVLLDLSLPDSKGLQTLRKIFAQDPHIPIVVLTGNNDELLAVKAVQEGAQDYLVKGDMSARLLSMSVRYAIERQHSREELKRKNEELAKTLNQLEQRVQERTAQLTTANNELKHAVEELTASEVRFRGTFEQAAVGIAHISLDGQILRINKRYCNIMGYTCEEMLKKTSQEITFPDDTNIDVEQHNQLLEGKIQTYSMEKRYLHKNSDLFWVNLTVSLMRDTNNSPIYFINVVEDITTRKEAEDKLGQTIEALIRSNAELEQFAYVASHDLQEPLRMVSSFVQLLADRYKGKLDAEAEKYIKIALDGASHMQNLIQDLLMFSRVTSRGQMFQNVNVDDVLNQVLNDLSVSIQESHSVISIDHMPTVYADPTQLGQVFQNLISNAIKFRGEQPPNIHIGARQQTGEWIFSIADNGIGIDKKYFDKLFVIFRRIQPRGKYPGTGIGLATCKKIVERHGGRIWVESELGKGSTFFFSITGATKMDEKT